MEKPLKKYDFKDRKLLLEFKSVAQDNGTCNQYLAWYVVQSGKKNLTVQITIGFSLVVIISLSIDSIVRSRELAMSHKISFIHNISDGIIIAACCVRPVTAGCR